MTIRRMTTEERAALMAKVAAEYRANKTVREIAKNNGLSYGGTHRMLVAAGVIMRSRGGPRRRKRK